ncbi:hypothetical protein ACWGJ2_33420 [Streptomyces sp. NPDC054796]
MGELVAHVDEYDRVLGVLERGDAMRDGMLYRIATTRGTVHADTARSSRHHGHACAQRLFAPSGTADRGPHGPGVAPCRAY